MPRRHNFADGGVGKRNLKGTLLNRAKGTNAQSTHDGSTEDVKEEHLHD